MTTRCASVTSAMRRGVNRFVMARIGVATKTTIKSGRLLINIGRVYELKLSQDADLK